MNTAVLNACAADATATGETHTKDQKERTGLGRSVIAGLAPVQVAREIRLLVWRIEISLDMQTRVKLLQRTLGGGKNRGLL